MCIRDRPNTIQYTTLTDRAFSDFVLEVDAWQRGGAPESSYGVLFRIQEDGRFYRCLLYTSRCV